MSDGGSWEPLSPQHPGSTVHAEHGVCTVNTAGQVWMDVLHMIGAPRWNYEAPAMCGWCGCGWRGLHHRQAQPSTAGASTATREAEWDRANRPAIRAIADEWSAHVQEAFPVQRS